jgi:F-type H+-transporting ATPase subunit epsilon
MYIKIITPDKEIYEGEISQAKFPGSKGTFEVLKDHAPLISTLSKGYVTLNTEKDGRKEINIDGGVVEILKNKITVLVESVIE